MDGARRRIARLLGFAISAGCVALLAARVDWARFTGHFSAASWLPLATAVPLVVFTYFLFALRWRLLLTMDPVPPVLHVFRYLMAGYAANAVLPMRAGDALRVVLLRRACGYGTTRVASSVALERILDALTLIAMGAAVALYADLPRTILFGLRTAGIAAAVAVGIIAAIAARRRIAIATIDGIAGRIAPRHRHAVIAQAEQLVDALDVLFPRDRQAALRAAAAVALGLAGWASYALAMALCMIAFGVTPVVGPALLLVAVTNLGAAIPSSPASIGVYHALGVLALSPWHVDFDLALSVVTATHAITVGVQVIVGSLAMILIRTHRTEVRASALSNRGG
jgi:uncharacterized protein (TIRG00374 family)